MNNYPKNNPVRIFCTFIVAFLLLVGTGSAAAPVADFTAMPTEGVAPLTVAFADASDGDPAGRAWFFGDEDYTQAWTPLPDAGWSARSFPATVALPDGTIVLMGGREWPAYTNDTWQSTDGGRTWIEVNASSGWTARSGHTAVALPDGTIVLMGGFDGIAEQNDTWVSTDRGVTWEQVNASSGWTARQAHTAVALPDGSVVLMGGCDDTGFLNDVWRSEDGGVTWTKLPDAGWSKRMYPESVAMPDGSILLMGGSSGGPTGGLRNDVWRSEDGGRTWTELPRAGWSERMQPRSVALADGSVLLMGGYDGGCTNDIWRSTDDGATWTRVPDAGWTGRSGHTAVALPDGSVVVMGGYDGTDRNDVWQFRPAGSTDQDPTHTYEAAGTYTVTLRAFNAGGYTRATREITATAPVAPTAAFTGTPLSGTAPLTVAFTDTSTGDPTGRTWFFGDEDYTEEWTPLPDAAWPARICFSSVATPDGTIIIMGGWDETTNLNDVWRSADGGETWTKARDARWSARSHHAGVALPDGSIVLMGGSDTASRNDTWISIDKGMTWTLQNASSGWTARGDSAAVALPDGSIVLMGGSDPQWKNDTWISTDRGATWTLQNASSGWTGRIFHSSVAMPDGSIILTGGLDGTARLNDTWRSTDGGVTWTLMNASSGWAGRTSHSMVAMPDGSVLLMGGWNGTPLHDVWRSEDNGATWTRLPDAAWSGRYYHAGVALPDGSVVVMGGTDNDASLNDVWRLTPAGSTDQNPSHTYTTPGTYTVTLQAFNAGGYTRATGTVTVRAPSSGGGDDDDSWTAPAAQSLTTRDVTVSGRSAVSRVNVTGTGISGIIVTGTVRSSPGSGVPPAPGSVFEYVDLVPARYTNITGATVTFTVPVAWLEEHRLSPTDVVLYHYANATWTALPTTVGATADGQVGFTATSPGFSLYAISGVAEVPAEPTTIPTPAATASPATPVTTAEETTAVPMTQQAAPALPLAAIAVGGGFLLRRRRMRRQ
ncbi:PGF-pre-PGF domain-containing protein [Methanofollis formosanus]|uniref:PGF-pre-PGF domain-containing protein n=1 Tax=Methanofollis formosanus TaxID=299308 RepID=A0A8G1A1W1_9EURY|nr:kelch repeat-containing protein [Methanofollis formosanus]QYZ78896.1 PGF-pre-PGF domain-containing protein [Methanofollis formosanus]